MTVLDLSRSPAYALPLVVNLTGSVWFFLLIGRAGRWFGFFDGAGGERAGERWEKREKNSDEVKEDWAWDKGLTKAVWCLWNGDADPGCAELSLTIPITNSLAFLFTVLGEWWAEGKVISRGQYPPYLA